MGIRLTPLRVSRWSLLAIIWPASLYGAWLLGSTGWRESSTGSGKLRAIPASATTPLHAGGTAAEAPGETRRPAHKAAFAARLDTLLLQSPGPQREREILALFDDWAGVNPLEAFQRAAEMKGTLLRCKLRSRILERWGKNDPEAAWAFAKSNKTSASLENWFDDVLNGIGQANLPAALKFLEDHGEERGTGGGYFVVEKLFEAGHADALLPWAEKLPEGRLRDTSIRKIVGSLAYYDPLAAKAWMEKVIPAEKADKAHLQLARNWGEVDPVAAIEWIRTLPQQKEMSELFAVVTRHWFRKEPAAAADWLAAQPPNTALDPSIEEYVNHSAIINPADSMPWAESIADAGLRQRVMTRVAANWRMRDRPAFDAWLASADLPTDLKSQLLPP